MHIFLWKYDEQHRSSKNKSEVFDRGEIEEHVLRRLLLRPIPEMVIWPTKSKIFLSLELPQIGLKIAVLAYFREPISYLFTLQEQFRLSGTAPITKFKRYVFPPSYEIGARNGYIATFGCPSLSQTLGDTFMRLSMVENPRFVHFAVGI